MSSHFKLTPEEIEAGLSGDTAEAYFHFMRQIRTGLHKPDDNGKIHFSIPVEEASQFYQRAQALEEVQYRDRTTGLLNKHGMYELLGAHVDLLAHSLGYDDDSLFILADLDNFKQVNAEYGYIHGDRLINATTNFLSLNTKQNTDWARFGGDEFVTIFDKILSPETRLEELVEMYKEDSVIRELDPKGLSSLSVGGVYIGDVALGLGGRSAVNYLTDQAQEGLQHIKTNGKGTYHITR